LAQRVRGLKHAEIQLHENATITEDMKYEISVLLDEWYILPSNLGILFLFISISIFGPPFVMFL